MKLRGRNVRRRVRSEGRRVPGMVLGPPRPSRVLVLLAEEDDAVCAAAPAAEAGRAVVVRWHPDHPEDAVLDEDVGDPWLLVGTTAPATVLDAHPLGLGAFRHRLEVRPAGDDPVERFTDLAALHRPGIDFDVLWTRDREDALAGAAVARIATARREALHRHGVRAQGRVVSVTDTRRRAADGAAELVVVVEVFPPDGTEPFLIARRGAFRAPKAVGQPAQALFHPAARHLHVVTF